jgi:hypothetical protein
LPWQQNLIRDRRGAIQPVLANALTALRFSAAPKFPKRQKHRVEQVHTPGTTRPDARLGSPEWARLQVDKLAKYCYISLDLWPCSYDFRQTPELKQFADDYRQYLRAARKEGRIGKRKEIIFSDPGGSYFFISVLREDIDYWVERVKKLVHLGNLRPIRCSAKPPNAGESAPLHNADARDPRKDPA